MILRRELPEDQTSIFAVHTAAFGGGNTVVEGVVNGAADGVVERVAERVAGVGGGVVEARLNDELRGDGDVMPALSIVATVDGEVVGHVVCSRASVDGRPCLGLGPIGVLPTHQGRGVGHALMHAVLGAADALDEQAVVLLGDPGYYRRFGFVLASTVGLLPPDPGWVEHFQVRTLNAWDGSLVGTFRYAPAFERL